MNPNVRNFSLWVIIFLLVVALVMLFQNPSQREASQQITFSQLLTEVDQSRVREVTIAGNEITGHFNDNRAFSTYAPNDPTLVQKLYSKNVSIAARPPQEGGNWLVTLLVNGLPLIAKNGTLASPAIALASKVLPVPGGPTSSTPRGMRPPSR